MTNKTFTVAGVSKINGQHKVRFGNDLVQRIKIRAKTDQDMAFITLPEPMTKPQVVKFLKTSELYLNSEYAIAIDNADAKYNPDSVVKISKPRGRPPGSLNKKQTITMDGVVARLVTQ